MTEPDSAKAAENRAEVRSSRSDRFRRPDSIMLLIAFAIAAADHLSFVIGFATGGPGLIVSMALLPPLIGSIRWPLLVWSIARARRNAWWYLVPAALFTIYIVTGLYLWGRCTPDDWNKFIEWSTSNNMVFVLVALHIASHVMFWIAAMGLLTRDLYANRRVDARA